MKTSRPEKKLSCTHVDSNSTFPYKHIGAAAENGYTVTMAEKDNDFLTGALQKQHNGQETLQVPGAAEGCRGVLEVGTGRGNSSRPTGSLRYPCPE
jgi:hypothetical protein